MDSKAFSTPKRFFTVSLGNVDKVFASAYTFWTLPTNAACDC
jgi:hypothetical protein